MADASLGTATLKTRLDPTGLEAGFRRVERTGTQSVSRLSSSISSSIRGINPALDSFANKFNRILTGLKSPLGILTVGLGAAGLAAAGLTRRGLPQVREFNSALRLLVATGEDFTKQGLSKALNEAADAAGRAGKLFSRAELAGALADTIKAGVDAGTALKLLAPAMRLASVTGETLNDTTALLLQNLRQFGLDATDAAKAADELARADLLSADSASGLSRGLSTVGPLAKAAGLSLAQTLGILTDLSNKGLEPAGRGATGLRSALTQLLTPTEDAQKVLKELGVSTEDASGHLRNGYDILTDFRDALQATGLSYDENTQSIKGNSDAARQASQVFESRAITAVLAIGKATDDFTRKIENSTGALQKYSDTFTQANLEASEKALKVALDNVSESFVLTFTPAIVDATDRLSSFLGALDTAANSPSWEKIAKLGVAFQDVLGFTPAIPKDVQDILNGITTSPSGRGFGNQGGALSGGGGGGGGGAPAGASLGDLFATARRLLLDVQNAKTPQAVYDAAQAISDFKKSDDRAANALAAVSATLSTTATATATGAAGPTGDTGDPVSVVLAQGPYQGQLNVVVKNPEASLAGRRTAGYLASRSVLGTDAGDAARAASQSQQAGLTATQAAEDRIAQRRASLGVKTDLEAARTASGDIEQNLLRAATDARTLRENANIRAGAQARLGLEAQDAARNANAQRQRGSLRRPGKRRRPRRTSRTRRSDLAARRKELALKSFVPLDRAMEQSAIAADRLAASERNILRGRLATQGGAPFSGRAPTAGSSAFGQATNYSSYLEVLRQGGAKQAQVNRETRKTQIDAAEKFRDTVISAGFGFADTLVQGIKTGDVGSIFGGLGGAVGSVLSAVPGFGLAGSIVTGAAGLIGSIFGGAGGQQDQAAQAAELRRSRGVPAVNINATVNQSNTINGSPNAQVEAYVNRQMRDIILQVLQELNIPKTLKQVTAGA